MKCLPFIAVLCISMVSCHKQMAGTSIRTFRMGFAASAPRYDFNTIVQATNIWSSRADAAIISTEPPWDSLLDGENIATYITDNYTGLVQYYRQKSYSLWVYIDPENGLNRVSDADALVKRGKTISNSDIQGLYVRFVVLMDSLLRPDHLGLALETNLIRGTASPSIYQGVKSASNAAAVAIRTFDATVPLSVSVQVDYAWGKISGQPYIGVDNDLSDFPFIQELGLSSYPYFNFNTAADIPDNYYARLVEGRNLPVMVTEGGWTSAPIPLPNGGSISGSPLLQQQYVDRQAVLLSAAKATAWFQLAFTDIDLSSLPPSISSNIQYFATIGLVDIHLQSKPALHSWDSIFNRPLH